MADLTIANSSGSSNSSTCRGMMLANGTVKAPAKCGDIDWEKLADIRMYKTKDPSLHDTNRRQMRHDEWYTVVSTCPGFEWDPLHKYLEVKKAMPATFFILAGMALLFLFCLGLKQCLGKVFRRNRGSSEASDPSVI